MVALLLTASTSPAGASPQNPRRWVASAYSGISVWDFSRKPAAQVGLSILRRLWRGIEIAGIVSGLFGEQRSQVALCAGVGYGVGVGQVMISPGFTIGAAIFRSSCAGVCRPFWTSALLLTPRVQIAYRLRSWLELEAVLPAVSLYYNRFWIAAWEPSIGFGLAF